MENSKSQFKRTGVLYDSVGESSVLRCKYTGMDSYDKAYGNWDEMAPSENRYCFWATIKELLKYE